MFLATNSILPIVIPPKEDASSASSVKSGKSGNSDKTTTASSKKDKKNKKDKSSASIHSSDTMSTKDNQSLYDGQTGANSYYSSSIKSGNILNNTNPISSPLTIPPQFTSTNLLNTIPQTYQPPPPPHQYPSSPSASSFSQQQNFQTHTQPLTAASQNPTDPMDSEAGQYRQALQWLQQTCRPVFIKELAQVGKVPVPIMPVDARQQAMFNGMRHVHVAIWKQSKVQVLPMERWGNPMDVVQEMQALHKLRKCRQIIQLYGYLPNSNPTGTTQIPALLIQQPSYGSLRQFLDHHFDSIQWPERYKLGLDMAQGLRFLAAHNMHCEMHSGSVLVDGEGVAVLTGFGVRGGIASAPCNMTAQPSTSAQVAYMAPERLAGRPFSTEWAVFSLGILLWELSSGRPPFEDIIARAERGPRHAKNMEHLTGAIIKGLREEAVAGTPEIYEQLFKMCWESDAESRPPLEVVEETLQMLVVVEPMDMLMLPGDDLGMSVSTVVSDLIDTDSISSHGPTRSNSVRSVSPGNTNPLKPFARPTNLHQAISVSNADMTEWYILSGHDLNGYALVGTYSAECEITPLLTCVGHFLPASLPILKDLLEHEIDVTLTVKRSFQNAMHVLLDRYIPIKNDSGSAHLFQAVEMLLHFPQIDINAQDVQGYTPLHLLMRNPRVSSEDVWEVYKRLLAKGADTSLVAPRDGNVLALASKYLHFEAMKAILQNDVTASDPDSIDRAIEACMTMTGRPSDTFVTLRTKCRELLKLWTGKAALNRREKVILKVLQDAGFLNESGLRMTINKPAPDKMLVPPNQIRWANKYYDDHMAKAKQEMTVTVGFGGVGSIMMSR